jgi:hypothetical protein
MSSGLASSLEGATFTQVRGNKFKFRAHETYLELDRTNHNVPRAHVAKALARWPISGPGQLQDLRGPSYIYALLVDARVRNGDY